MIRIPEIVFENASKFYGEVLGVNKVSLRIPPGITALDEKKTATRHRLTRRSSHIT